ncbi:alpha/beta fold hydrolase [Flavobacterium sp. W21_SRS_FM6]|uniref:alpha/beta fold hydrolase n=1 Tax=Flavobacterium sp. W21_SRS_FM6 TaxID=3240268 RepID=UPI003F919EEA
MRRYIFIISFVVFGCTREPYQFTNIDSYSLEYQILGNSKTCFALFEAGMSFDLDTFDPIFEQLSHGCTTIRYSRVGQGKSSYLSTELSAKNYAKIAKQLLDHLHIDQPVIFVGHSYGGMIARYFAELYPVQTKALLLIDPGTNWESKIIAKIDPSVVEKEITLLKNFGYSFAKKRPRPDGTLNELRDFWLKYPLPDFTDIGDVKVTVLASIQDMGDDLVIGSLQAMQIRANMLEAWVNEFPRGRFVSTTKSGHFIHVEEPELVITEFRKLLTP